MNVRKVYLLLCTFFSNHGYHIGKESSVLSISSKRQYTWLWSHTRLNFRYVHTLYHVSTHQNVIPISCTYTSKCTLCNQKPNPTFMYVHIEMYSLYPKHTLIPLSCKYTSKCTVCNQKYNPTIMYAYIKMYSM